VLYRIRRRIARVILGEQDVASEGNRPANAAQHHSSTIRAVELVEAALAVHSRWVLPTSGS
jgi:hypothetical protein